jgi:hypothetical protein
MWKHMALCRYLSWLRIGSNPRHTQSIQQGIEAAQRAPARHFFI